MTHTDPSTIDTLTATVNVVKVGGRQIPAALVKELDDVPFENVVVFGRINTDDPGVKFIGRDKHTGDLVVSTVARHHFSTFEGWDAWRTSAGNAYPLITLTKIR